MHPILKHLSQGYARACKYNGVLLSLVLAEILDKVVMSSCLILEMHVQDGCINVLQSPIGARLVHQRQEEVARCLEAVSAASQVAGRLWDFQRRRRNDGQSCTNTMMSQYISSTGRNSKLRHQQKCLPI